MEDIVKFISKGYIAILIIGVFSCLLIMRPSGWVYFSVLIMALVLLLGGICIFKNNK